jgi:dihydrofolate synthase / folylpolyglutamate synthase
MTVFQRLFSKKPRQYRGNLDIAWKLSTILSAPQSSYPTIHVTGTNGKGSVCLKIAKALENTGLKVGLFTSPHIDSFCERISINGVDISQGRAESGILRLFEIEEASFFEIATFLAFDYFREQKVDIAVIEAGIGGLLDSTNVITPEVSVITSISRDHEDVLGATLEEIAFQKAGIIKPGVPVVIGPTADFPIIRERASTLFKVDFQPGFYDHENTAIAQKALEILGVPIRGCEVRPRCRFEQIGRNILDAAHNAAGFVKLLEAYDEHFPQEPFIAVLGMSSDKDVRSCLSILASRADHIYLVQADSSKALPVLEMSQMLRQEGYDRLTAGLSIQESLKAALASGKRIVVCGSFYIMKEADEVLRIQVGGDQLLLARGQAAP